MRRFCMMAAAVAALALTATAFARTTHHRWNTMTLTQRRAVVARVVRVQRSHVRRWFESRTLADASVYRFCVALGTSVPGPVCVHGQKLTHALTVLRHIDARLTARAAAARQQALVHDHYSGWLCIHSREGAWNANTGNGYLGGLQMTPGWGGLARPDLAPPSVQIATAEYQASLNHWSYTWMQGQWPNTFPPCAGYFE